MLRQRHNEDGEPRFSMLDALGETAFEAAEEEGEAIPLGDALLAAQGG